MCLQCRRPRFDSWVGKIHWRRGRLPTPVFLGFSLFYQLVKNPPAVRETWVQSVLMESYLSTDFPVLRQFSASPIFLSSNFHIFFFFGFHVENICFDLYLTLRRKTNWRWVKNKFQLDCRWSTVISLLLPHVYHTVFKNMYTGLRTLYSILIICLFLHQYHTVLITVVF